MSAILGGLRRTLAHPGLWVGCWLALTLGAALLGRAVSFVVASAAVPYEALAPDHLIYGLVDILESQRAAAAAVIVALVLSALMSAVSWMVLSPLCIARLATKDRDAGEVAARALRRLPAVAVQSLWHLVLRGVLVFAVLLTIQPLPAVVGWSVLVAVWLAAGVALDATRVAVVEHDAAPYHIRSAARAFVYVVRRPALLLPCGLMSLAQLALTAVGLWLALAWLSGGTPWVPRLLALVSVGLGLWRVATVVQRMHDDPLA